MSLRGKHAVIDLDDTLSGLRYPLMDTMNRLKNKNIHWEKWGVLDIEQLYGITNDEFLLIAGENFLLERSQPHPEAREFMYKLHNAGLETTILTARGWHPRAKEMTQNWLNLYDIPHTQIVVCNLECTKADYIRHMDNVLFTIDDSPRHCNGYSTMELNRPEYVFVYDMPWNITNLESDVIRIKNLEEISNHIEGL